MDAFMAPRRSSGQIIISADNPSVARAKEEILGQFLGDETFPVDWESEAEKRLFWVFDDLHCPNPLSPMFADIGGWWLSCDHMFRRFGTDFASDWLAKFVNGYVYTAVIPADPNVQIDSTRYGSRYAARVPRDPNYAATISKYGFAVLPTYGRHFAAWWRDRLVPEMTRNYAYLEGKLDEAERMLLMELAVLLEDAIDIHDRHWKIHWMLNFAQFSATLNLRAAIQKWRGSVDEVVVGRLQNSASDRNWDSIKALWELKEEVRKNPELTAAFKGETAKDILEHLHESDRGRRFLTDRVAPYQREYGYHAVWSHEFIFPTVREQVEPVIELVRGYVETGYDYPKTIAAVKADIESAADELLHGLTGNALDEISRLNDINLQMAPLTPDHHFYIDQGANAHLRLVLIAIGAKLVEMGVLDQPDDVMFLQYNELRIFMGDPSAKEQIETRGLITTRRAERKAAYRLRPPDWIGTVTATQLAVPYLANWGFPEKFHRKASKVEGRIEGLGGSPGVVEGIARVVLTVEQFDHVRKGDVVVCQMTNPAWVALFTKMAGLVTDAGGLTSHAAVLAREFAIPAVIGTSLATRTIKDGDRIRVNGTTGVVDILERSKAAAPRSSALAADRMAQPR
ncbi:MAG: PEP-utilizing protein [Chloroflexi bacterium 13_1_40CM_65_17]|nr:MAG: PEP-utilizing protein [Chloroflexi bacterium 13_1_40CM_65_17]